MRIPFYHVNAFTDRLFAGNPAGVCVLDDWPAAETMQAIAAENALVATAFIRREREGYGLRWFTPTVELDLCGHGTMGAAYVALIALDPGAVAVRFRAASAVIAVAREGERLAMDFPAQPLQPCEPSPVLLQALGRAPKAVLAGRSYVAVFGEENDIAAIRPDMQLLARLDLGNVIVTAPGRESDIVSRNFAPKRGIPEDPVTGSAHAQIVPYWAEVLGKKEIYAHQLSARGGSLWCEAKGDRVKIAGHVTFYMKGEIRLAD